MTRNIDHGDHLPAGWRPLFAKLIADLEAMDAEVKVVQAKQKFGSMRVYVERGTRAMYDLLSAAERSSLTICEECGADAWVRKNWRGHWRTLCEDHAGDFVRLTSRPWPAVASDVPPADDAVLRGQELEEVRKLEELQHDTIEFKKELIKEAGGVLDAEAAQALLELPSVGAVHEAVRQRKLFAVEDNNRLWFPNCQFDGGSVHQASRQSSKPFRKPAGGGSCNISLKELTASPVTVRSTSSRTPMRTSIVPCALLECWKVEIQLDRRPKSDLRPSWPFTWAARLP